MILAYFLISLIIPLFGNSVTVILNDENHFKFPRVASAAEKTYGACKVTLKEVSTFTSNSSPRKITVGALYADVILMNLQNPKESKPITDTDTIELIQSDSTQNAKQFLIYPQMYNLIGEESVGFEVKSINFRDSTYEIECETKIIEEKTVNARQNSATIMSISNKHHFWYRIDFMDETDKYFCNLKVKQMEAVIKPVTVIVTGHYGLSGEEKTLMFNQGQNIQEFEYEYPKSGSTIEKTGKLVFKTDNEELMKFELKCSKKIKSERRNMISGYKQRLKYQMMEMY